MLNLSDVHKNIIMNRRIKLQVSVVTALNIVFDSDSLHMCIKLCGKLTYCIHRAVFTLIYFFLLAAHGSTFS